MSIDEGDASASSLPLRAPTARYVGSTTLVLLGSLPLAGFVGWTVAHVFVVMSAVGAWRTMTVAWLVTFVLLWWVPVAWFERPRAPSGRRADLDALTVTVQIPVYNEDPSALRACLRSVLTQSRRVDRVRVVDDGSADKITGEPVTYEEVHEEFLADASVRGVEATWDRTENRGKRFAQMHVLATDDADVFVTVDSDSVLDRHAVREGLKPFADPRVQSVAGQVVVLNHKANPLTMLTCVLYLSFARGLRSAQSVLRRVTINSGTLAFYRADVVRGCAGVYENERFGGRPMQMNDDSMLTFYALLKGDTVHQPSSIAFTLVPERPSHYVNQQLRWMRGTTVRHLWWLRYMPVTGVVFWATVAEYLQLLLALAIPVALVAESDYRQHLGSVAVAALEVGIVMNYLVALRLFTLRRDDMSQFFRIVLFVLSPLAVLWRLLVLRPLYLYAMLTCRRVNRWGTRDDVEVAMGADSARDVQCGHGRCHIDRDRTFGVRVPARLGQGAGREDT